MEEQSPAFCNTPRGAEDMHSRCMQFELVAKVEFLERTYDDTLKVPSFIGLREDKRPTDIVRE